MSGKGSKQRISQVSLKQFETNWNKVFGTSSERIAEQLLEEDKAICDRLEKQGGITIHSKNKKAADTKQT